MARVPVFYSFHFDNDVFRVQQIRNMGVVDGDEPVSANDWEQIKRKGDAAVERWIADNMNYRRCVIVLIGSETADRKWVKYEIKKAWEDGRGLFGIYVHNLKDPRTGTSTKGANPFSKFTVDGRSLATLVSSYDPNRMYPYADIHKNLETWVNAAVAQAKARTGK